MCHSSLSMCSGAAASKQCILQSYDCSSLQVLIQLILRELHILRPVLQQVSCMCVHACARVHVCAVNICLCGFQCLTVFLYMSHVGHVHLQQYGFRTRLIFPSYFRLFLLRASLDQSKTSTKQKTKKPSQTWHTICGNNYSLRREMSAQTKQVK